jgi:hypothetical protein
MKRTRIREIMRKGPLLREARKALAELVAQPLSGTTNILGTRWFFFGKLDLNREDQAAPYILSLECAWRLERGGRIMVGSTDFDLEPEGEQSSHAVDLDWNLQNERLLAIFGETRQGYIISTHPLVVDAIEVDEVGGFTLNFQYGYRLVVFPCSCTLEEWGLLRLPGQGRFCIAGGKWSDTRSER